MIVSMMTSMMQMQQNQRMHEDNMKQVNDLNKSIKEQESDFQKELADLEKRNADNEQELADLKKRLNIDHQQGGNQFQAESSSPGTIKHMPELQDKPQAEQDADCSSDCSMVRGPACCEDLWYH